MTTFDKREEGFEKKFAHDEELRFKANARRNKLLGLWAAEKLGLTGADADAYAKEVVMADFEEAGDDDVLRKVRKDFDAKGVAPSDQEIRTHHERPDGAGDRQIEGSAHGGIATTLMIAASDGTLPGFSLARRLRAGETVYTGWCGLACADRRRDDRARGLQHRHHRQQHGLWDTAATVDGIAAIRGGGAAPIVRVPLGDFAVASRALDFGAEGIIAPMINTVADARAFVSAAKFPPLGERSWGPHARHDARRHRRSRRTICARPTTTIVTLAMIETKHRDGQSRRDRGDARHRRAVRRPVRPVDRRCRDGDELDPHSATVEAALDKIVAAASKAGKIAGALLRQRRARGGLRQARHPLPRGRQRPRLPARRRRARSSRR